MLGVLPKRQIKVSVEKLGFFSVGFLCVILGIVDLVSYIKMLDAN